jgi:hypothetical protein
VVTQISAATKALEQAGFKLVAAGLTYCLATPDEAEATGYPLDVEGGGIIGVNDVGHAGLLLGGTR